MEVNEKQIKRVFYLGDEYGPDFVGLHSTEFEMDGNRLIVIIRTIVYDAEQLFVKPVALRVRRITIDENGEIFDQETNDEPYVEEVMSE